MSYRSTLGVEKENEKMCTIIAKIHSGSKKKIVHLFVIQTNLYCYSNIEYFLHQDLLQGKLVYRFQFDSSTGFEKIIKRSRVLSSALIEFLLDAALINHLSFINHYSFINHLKSYSSEKWLKIPLRTFNSYPISTDSNKNYDTCTSWLTIYFSLVFKTEIQHDVLECKNG